MFHALGYNPLYDLKELQHACLIPARMLMLAGKEFHGNNLNPIAHTDIGKNLSATFTLLERMTRDYARPEFGLTHTTIDDKEIEITEEIVLEKAFCKLLHFKKREFNKTQPKILLVAPMSGHYATLLRGTVEGLLPVADVYITDWMNARDVHVTEGEFNLDTHIDYCIEFMQHLAPDLHVMAVCQPAVPVLAAVSLMSSDNDPAVPASMVLMGGPIDVRRSPTEVNEFAMERSIKWFERTFITRVPYKFNGYMRQVYPGFIQLGGFMAMNANRHIGEHMQLFQHLVEGDGESAEQHKKFYNEYLAVMDLPAEFYLQTVETVFQEYALPLRKMVSRGRKVDTNAITKTALLTIEGEKDDISGIGQTKAAMRLCKNIPENRKHYHLQKDVGHYGVFNGRRYREYIVPEIMNFIKRTAPKKAAND